MRMLIEEINPGITVETHAVRITAANCATLFAATDVVVEALDEAEEKAMLIETVLSFSKNVPLVAASGIGGYGNNNAIKTERFENLFFCGDGETEVDEGVPLFAPRVALVAAMQANVVLELLLGPYEYK
jgi:sulfur carrier protein ThiS adenylyltransferase